MDDSLYLEEKLKYDAIWANIASYRNESPSEMLAPFYLHHFGEDLQPNDLLLDFGCGTGRAAKSFLSRGLRVGLLDLSSHSLDDGVSLLTRLLPDRLFFREVCLWNLPADLLSAEWGLCCDVMEHIPPEKIDATLTSIASRIKKGGLFSIHLIEDSFGAAIGMPLHLTLQPKEWWQETLERHFSKVSCLKSEKEFAVFEVLSHSQ